MRLSFRARTTGAVACFSAAVALAAPARAEPTRVAGWPLFRVSLGLGSVRSLVFRGQVAWLQLMS